MSSAIITKCPNFDFLALEFATDVSLSRLSNTLSIFSRLYLSPSLYVSCRCANICFNVFVLSLI